MTIASCFYLGVYYVGPRIREELNALTYNSNYTLMLETTSHLLPGSRLEQD